jgi:hypothetical protein
MCKGINVGKADKGGKPASETTEDENDGEKQAL